MKSAAEQLVPAPARALPDIVFDAEELESPQQHAQSEVSRGQQSPLRRSKEEPAESWLAQLSLSDVLVPASLLLLAFVALCAAFPATVAPYLPTDMHSDAILSSPGRSHLFGTDQFG